MSEKGQGDDSAEAGTGIAIDGTASGGGSAADQTGPHEGDTRTRGRGEWSSPDPDLADLKVSDAPPPTVPEDTPREPTFPGGGPADTRSGWDDPSGEGPRGDPPPDEPEPEEPTETPEQQAQRQAAEQEQRRRAYDDAMTRRAEAEARESGQTDILPPDLSSPEGEAEEGSESINKYNDNKPVIT